MLTDREYYLVYLNTWNWELFPQEFETYEEALGFARVQSIETKVVRVTMMVMEDGVIEGRIVDEEE